MRPDILVKDKAGRSILAVEVKARRNMDAAWAAQFRRNLYAHESQGPADYFVIVTTDRAFLWSERNEAAPASARPPTAEIATQDLLGRANGASHASGEALKLSVSGWVWATIEANDVSNRSSAVRGFLEGSGLFEALRGTAVDLQPA